MLAPGLGKGVYERIHRRDHQVHVERLFRMRTKLLDHGRAEGQVRHEMAVHDIDVDHVGASMVDGPDFLTETGKVCGENRR
jgi:hypothetical protein